MGVANFSAKKYRSGVLRGKRYWIVVNYLVDITISLYAYIESLYIMGLANNHGQI